MATPEQEEIEPITSTAVTEADVVGKWDGDWEDLTALQKIALAEGNQPAPRPLSQAERESNTGTTSASVDGGMSPLQRIAALEAESKKGSDPQPVVEDVVVPTPEPEVVEDVETEPVSDHKADHKSSKSK